MRDDDKIMVVVVVVVYFEQRLMKMARNIESGFIVGGYRCVMKDGMMGLPFHTATWR